MKIDPLDINCVEAIFELHQKENTIPDTGYFEPLQETFRVPPLSDEVYGILDANKEYTGFIKIHCDEKNQNLRKFLIGLKDDSCTVSTPIIQSFTTKETIEVLNAPEFLDGVVSQMQRLAKVLIAQKKEDKK